MQLANHHRQLTFDEAIQVAIDLVPGLAHDFQIIADQRKYKAKDMEGIGRIGLSIPDPVFPLLKQYFPQLFQDDTEEQGKAWKRFIMSSESERFRVQRKI